MSTDFYDIELPKLSSEQHKDKTFELIFVMDMLISTEKRFYRLLFKHVDSNMYIIEELAPELFFQFSTGMRYQDSFPTADKPIGDIKEIPISGAQHIVGKMQDFLNDDEFDFDHKISLSNGTVNDFSNEIKDQYCIAYKHKGQTIILPSYLVGSKFFFVSTNMRKRIFDSKPEKLYEKIEFEGNLPIIHLKPGVALADGPYLVHNFQHNHANESWHAIRNSLNHELYGRPSRTWHVPLKITLPFEHTIKMVVRYSQLPNNKILIHEILDHQNFFSFSNLRVITSGRDDDEESPTNIIPRKNRKKSKKLTQTPPSSRNTYAGIRNKVEESSLRYQGVEIDHQTEEDDDKASKTSTSTEYNNDPTNVSSMSPTSGGDEDTSHLNANQGNDKDEENNNQGEKGKQNRCTALFTREHFKNIFYAISQHEDVSHPELFTDKTYPWRVGSKKCNQKETYDKECDNRRKWHYCRFKYQKAHVAVIDLDQNGLSSGSSIFILKSSVSVSKRTIHGLLRDYAGNKKFKDIKVDLNANGVTLLTKKHKCPNKEGVEKSWTNSLVGNLVDSDKL